LPHRPARSPSLPPPNAPTKRGIRTRCTSAVSRPKVFAESFRIHRPRELWSDGAVATTAERPLTGSANLFEPDRAHWQAGCRRRFSPRFSLFACCRRSSMRCRSSWRWPASPVSDDTILRHLKRWEEANGDVLATPRLARPKTEPKPTMVTSPAVDPATVAGRCRRSLPQSLCIKPRGLLTAHQAAGIHYHASARDAVPGRRRDFEKSISINSNQRSLAFVSFIRNIVTKTKYYLQQY
jgi:hypothetical protein